MNRPVDTRVGFVPAVGPEQEIIDLMHACLTPECAIHVDEDAPEIIGEEECARRIVELLRKKGCDL